MHRFHREVAVFITVSGQKGGVAKTCTSIHLASVWSEQGRNVCVVDADRNRSALAYGIRGTLPFTIVPVEAAAKATRHADVVITDGQASSDEEELRHLAVGSDLVLLPTAPKARSVELTVELAQLLQKVGVPHAVLMAKVLFFLFVFIWIRWTIPRFRYDQLMNLGWKKLIPLSLVNMLITAALTLWLNK